MSFEKRLCLFWTVLLLSKSFCEAGQINSRDFSVALTPAGVPVAQESWFEKIVEYFAGKVPMW